MWSNSEEACALSDDDRHLGHIIFANGWQAFDATKLNDTGDSYRYIGRFRARGDAQAAVEKSVFRSEGPMVLTAH